ncbi:hypothetical protein ABE485_24330 [Achromobacter spanius]|uniref:hypothetical protein n=1 Tax=Achromobacter spanius TaxID=217203 RepID=UPI003209F199
MSIRSSVHALLFAALLAPTMASADTGVIRFVGAIVEPGKCMPRVTQASPGAHPQVACAPVAGGRAFDPVRHVKTDVRAIQSAEDKASGATPRRYLVTLEYL